MMALLPDTRHSLIMRLAESDGQTAWLEFSKLYEQAIYRFARSRSLQPADAEEVVQEVMLAVHRVAPTWNNTGHAGGFRTWLVTAMHRICLATLRKRQRAIGVGDIAMDAVASSTDFDEADERDWRDWAFCWAAGEVQLEILPQTWRAFWLTSVANEPPDEVAKQLNMSIGSVYAAKCRTIARIRERISTLENQS
jgi:RNA polymerase sigma-70 factor, ECF subfamily